MKKMQTIAPAVSLAIGTMFLCSAAQAVVVDSIYYTGLRTTVGTTGNGGGLIWNPAAGDWSGGNFSISWEIIFNQTSNDYTYTYKVNTPSGGNARLSHWILELSQTDADGHPLETYWEDVFVTPSTTPGNYSDNGIGAVAADDVGAPGGVSNVGMPQGMWGVKFTRDSDQNTTTVTFTTPQVPVWGDFYARDGGGNDKDTTIYAYNSGFGSDPAVNATSFTGWIARPDGTSGGGGGGGGSVPEPATVGLLGLGMLAMGVIRRRKVALRS